jgi:hypothetical protein
METKDALSLVPINKLDDDFSISTSALIAVGSETNIALQVVTLDEEMRERLPSEFKNNEAALLVVFFNGNKQVTLGILLPPSLASELATMLYLMSVSLSLPTTLEKVTSKGGDEDVVSGRSSQQEASAFSEEGSEGNGSLPEPTNTGEQDKPTSSNESEEVQVRTNKPLPA